MTDYVVGYEWVKESPTHLPGKRIASVDDAEIPDGPSHAVKRQGDRQESLCGRPMAKVYTDRPWPSRASLNKCRRCRELSVREASAG
jgi:hypothetical protein